MEKGSNFPFKDPLTSTGTLQLGNVIFQRLGRFAGGYQGIDDSGFQLLINYRSPKGDPDAVAQHLTLSHVLNNPLSTNEIKALKNGIVLIGSTSMVSGKDYLSTPYKTMSGVALQAQMVSQLLSAVLDGRPLLRVLPRWADVLWIVAWSAIGGAIAYNFRSPLRLGLAGGIAVVSLFSLCLTGLIVTHLWIPLIPPAIALLITGGSIMYMTAHFAKLKRRKDQS